MTAFAEQMRPIIAAAMDEGWTTGDLRDAFEQVAEMERDARMNVAAAKVYGHRADGDDGPSTTATTPEAGAIVAHAKLPRGVYGIGEEGTGVVHNQVSAFDAVAAALARGRDHRLYRMADGWRFVGIVHADGSFTDERS